MAWRRLARQHHPDVSVGDPARELHANRTMAEINAAYQELRDPIRRRAHREAAARAARGGAPGGAGGVGSAGRRRGRSRPGRPNLQPQAGSRPGTGRPVTARIDTSALLRPRNSTLRPLDRSPLPGLPPRPRSVEGHEPPRASTPTGPMYRRRGPTMEADLPTLAEAWTRAFGSASSPAWTLGEVAAIEPSYIEWIVRTIDRDPEIEPGGPCRPALPRIRPLGAPARHVRLAGLTVGRPARRVAPQATERLARRTGRAVPTPRRGMRPGRRPKAHAGRQSWLLGSWPGPAASSYERPFVSRAEVAIDPARVRRPWRLRAWCRRPSTRLAGRGRSRNGP